MKFLIAGEAERGQQWERYLRKKESVTEVIVTPVYQGESVDGIVLLDESDSRLDTLLELIRNGVPSYLVSTLPLDTKKLQVIFHASEESNVSVQFSHWPSFSPMTRWVRKNLSETPLLVDIRKTVRGRTFPDPNRFLSAWIDEVAFILSLQTSSIQHITALPVRFREKDLGLHLTLRFDNGSVGSLHYLSVSGSESHQRVIQSKSSLITCDVDTQKAICYKPGEDFKLLNSVNASFDPSETAEISLDAFIRSIKTHKQSGFSALQVLRLAQLKDRITAQLIRA